MADDLGENAPPLHGAPLLMRVHQGQWVVPQTTTYSLEAQLRDLLCGNPSMLPGVVHPRAAAITEAAVPGVGRIDVLAVEPSGAITLCEAKLSGNSELRRTVIGQVLAYAAGLSRLSLEELDAAWAARRQGTGLVADVLGADATHDEQEALRVAVSHNLRDGRFRLVIAVDQLTPELRLIVTYLATHLDVDIAALELAYARHDDVEVLVPKTWGTEISQARSTSGSTGEYRRSTADTLPDLVASADSAAPGFGAVVQRVLTPLQATTYLWSSTQDMANPVVTALKPPARQPATIVTANRTTGIRVNFDWCRRLPPESLDKALDLILAHTSLEPIAANVRESDFRRRPIFRFPGVLQDHTAVDTLVAALLTLCE
jgi:hypothetical protein